MKLTKENVYVDLRGKSKEELNLITEITGAENLKNYYYLHFYTPLNNWIRYHVWTDNLENKTEVTIEQLKEILQPIDTLQQQLQKAEAEVKRLQSLIEEENKPKVGDWVYSTSGLCFYKKELTRYQSHERKITNPELIKLLEQEIK